MVELDHNGANATGEGEERMIESQIDVLMTVLREALRARGMRQRDVAHRLEVTERTVTRWLSGRGVDPRVIEQLCELVGMTFFDLCDLAARRVEQRICRLTVQQEQALADDTLLSYLFAQIRKGWSSEELCREVAIPEATFVDGVIRLEKLGLIEVLPGNEIRLRTVKEIEWRPNGPFSGYINKWLTWALDHADIGEPDALWEHDALMLSAASCAQLELKFRRLLQEARELSDIDRRLNTRSRDWYAFVLTLRPIDMKPLSEWSATFRHPRRSRPQAVASQARARG
jgi:transcriptional regulator with XRE-family HTH domain